MRRKNNRSQSSKHQSGAVLLVSMVLLVLLTLIVVSAIKSTNVNSKIVGNMQRQHEAEAASQQAVEALISQNFMADPVAAKARISATVDINNDGAPDFDMAVAVPTCKGVKPLEGLDLDVTNADDQKCFASSSGPGGDGSIHLTSGTTQASICSQTNWDISVTATDHNGSGATASTHQGIAVRVGPGATC
ncbi:PilX N-terminal domain-containing pilus assembly protein [Variovorax sp. HW608]|uniref:PilX N-terminal domain-containing pilus assembly protein n=1 Tax=Variovorax sp. HW608 TaxID=1034889 RepID=UPI0012FDF928|nr:PilX N-terminal domain-containing pilus assembly protein [Variovorax sp. HW608]